MFHLNLKITTKHTARRERSSERWKLPVVAAPCWLLPTGLRFSKNTRCSQYAHCTHMAFFQAEYCSRLSSDPGVRGRQGLCRGRKYWQSRPPFRLLREGVITSWWSLEGSMPRCGGYRMWKMRTMEGSRTKSEQHLIVTNTDESL